MMNEEEHSADKLQLKDEPAVRTNKRTDSTRTDEAEPKRFCERKEDDVNDDEALAVDAPLDEVKSDFLSSTPPACQLPCAKTSHSDELNGESKLTCSSHQKTDNERLKVEDDSSDKDNQNCEEKRSLVEQDCTTVTTVERAWNVDVSQKAEKPENGLGEENGAAFEKKENCRSIDSNGYDENQLQNSDESRKQEDLEVDTKKATASSELSDKHSSAANKQQWSPSISTSKRLSNEAEERTEKGGVEITDSQLISLSEASTVAKCVTLPHGAYAGATSLLKGLINELSSLNRFILDINKKMEGARRQRQEMLRISKRRGNPGTHKRQI